MGYIVHHRVATLDRQFNVAGNWALYQGGNPLAKQHEKSSVHTANDDVK